MSWTDTVVGQGTVVTKTASGAVYGVTYAITGSDTCAKATSTATETIIDGIANGDSLMTIVGNTAKDTINSVADSYLLGKTLSKISSNKVKGVVGWFAGDYYRGKYAAPNPIIEIHGALFRDACGEISRDAVKSIGRIIPCF